jgi:hypothetical protein
MVAAVRGTAATTTIAQVVNEATCFVLWYSGRTLVQITCQLDFSRTRPIYDVDFRLGPAGCYVSGSQEYGDLFAILGIGSDAHSYG